MSSESERRDGDREVGGNTVAPWPRGSPTYRPTDREDRSTRHPADLDGALHQRLSSLEIEPPARGAHLSREDRRRADGPPPPQRARKSALAGLLAGFGASLAVGLFLVGGLNWDDLMTAMQSRPGSLAELYPPRDTRHSQGGGSGPEQQTESGLRKSAPEPAAGYIAAVSVGEPCDAVLTAVRPGILRLQVTDPSRSGDATIVRVDDLDYRGLFRHDGRLVLLAPALFGGATVRWATSDGTPCSETAPQSGEDPHLGVALVWSGPAVLSLHVVEPSAWRGGPAGDISAGTPNLGRTRGAGELHSFGQPEDPARVEFYVAEIARLGQSGVLNAVVTLEPSPEDACAKAGEPTAVRYRLYSLRAGRDTSARPEIRSLAFELPPCGQADAGPWAVERIPIRF